MTAFCHRRATLRIWMVALGALAAAGPACAVKARPPVQERIESARTLDGRQLRGQPALEFMRARSAVVLADPASGTQPGRIAFTSLGTAAAIDRRGYFVTAAHVLSTASPALVLDAPARVVRARVVWRGDPGRKQPDLALVHVPLALDGAFEWAPDVVPGAGVVGAGPTRTTAPAADRQPLTLALSIFAGTIHNASFEGRDRRWQIVSASAPSVPGDSGGPLVNLAGRLVGVITGARWTFGFARSWTLLQPRTTGTLAVRPDLEWLRPIIDADAMGAANGPPASPPGFASSGRSSHTSRYIDPLSAGA
jgi:S1-C subfamily serine protease